MKKFLAALVTAAIGSAIHAQVPPEKAEATFTVHKPELEWKLWASEPLFANPTCMDIDHLGRVWVCESVNYRTSLHGKLLNRPAGDRILILDDSKGTGKADKVTVFYQSPELLAPLGIAIAKDPVGPGWKVYVCQSPDILVFEDKDGDGHADGPPKKLLTGFRGIDHDHGVHGILIGPDGKLYFSVGDQGVENLQSSDGKGRKWTTNHTDCQAGTLWRCDMDGTNLELIAHNFRNPYEPCVDSFGNIWMSDNDDDGTQQTRICYIMPGGNFGYWPRGPGESHWHEEQPGVVPKVLRTYFGSPTGMCVYEGTLLPKKYWGMPLHVDAGPRQVRCYHTKPKGAGYEIEREDIVTSTDNWFRPSDICVAPDGSVFVADWYDPGVGGHGMGDTTRGRIYRLAPKGNKYTVPKVDFSTNIGVIDSFRSPAQSVRYMASAEPIRGRAMRAVLSIARNASEKPDMRARALWLSQWLEPGGPGFVLQTMADPDPRLRCMALRAATDVRNDTAGFMRYDRNLEDFGSIYKLFNSPEAALRREALLFLSKMDAEWGVKPAIYDLMKLYDGHDRFYIAAIGIAVGTDPKRREIILADFDKQFPKWNDKVADLVSELRPPSMLPRLGKLLVDEKLSPAQRARIVDILAASEDKTAGLTVLKVLQTDVPAEVQARAIENLRVFLPGKWADVSRSDELRTIVDHLLGNSKTIPIGLQLVAAAKYSQEMPRVVRHAAVGYGEAIDTLGQLPGLEAVVGLEKLLRFRPSVGIINALGMHVGGEGQGGKHALGVLQGVVTASGPIEIKLATVSALAGSSMGSQWLLDQHASGKLPPDLISETGRLLRNSPFQALRNKALIAFPPPAKLDIAKLPPLNVLAARRGDPERGKQILASTLTNDAQCMKCHAVRGVGGKIGPDLATIGTKASRENLFESILFPSKAIADQYVQWDVTTTRGTTVSGLLIEDKPDHVLLRDANGKDIRVARKDISAKEKNPKSLMPEDIARTLTEEELVNLVEYLATLQSAGVK